MGRSRNEKWKSYAVFQSKKSAVLDLYSFSGNSRQLCALLALSEKKKSTTDLTVFDVETGERIFSFGHQSISCASIVDESLIIAGLENGDIRALSTKMSGGEKPVWETSCEGVSRCTSLSTNCNNTLLACGVQFASNSKVSTDDSDSEDESGEYGVLFYDLRSNPPSLLGAYKESHSDAICCLKFDSNDSDLLFSGSNDGLVNIFDLKQATEDDALQFTFNCVSAVSKLGTLKLDSKSCLYALADDSRLFSWTISDGEDIFNIENCRNLFPAVGDEQVFLVDCFQTTKTPENANSLFVLATDADGKIGISRMRWGKKEGTVLFDGIDVGHKDMVRCLVWNENDNLLYTGGDDGTVVCSDIGGLFEEGPAKKRIRK